MTYTIRQLTLLLAVLAAFTIPITSAQAQTFQTLYAFQNTTDGAYPGALLLHGGSLYGVTSNGGVSGWGTVFQWELAAKQVNTLYSFAGFPTDGSSPRAALIRDSAGNFYGTTYGGGSFDQGTLFELPVSGNETVLYSFSSRKIDGEGVPQGSVVRDAHGNLFGTTSDYGNGGVVFKLNSAGTYRTISSFKLQSDGFGLLDGLLYENGMLYGTAYAGGTVGYGVVFQIDPKTGAETVLYNFTGGADGGSPQGGVISDGAGNLYGTTTGGGSEPYTGVVFKLNIASGQETVLYSFTGGADGSVPLASLVRDAAGNLYSTDLRRRFQRHGDRLQAGHLQQLDHAAQVHGWYRR